MNKIKTKREHEIINSFKAFQKDEYNKDEVLSELIKLEEEAVKLIYNGEHSDFCNLKLHDVYKHMEQMSIERYGTVIEEVSAFRRDCFSLHNMIKAEISGRKGEMKSFRSLNNLKCRNILLKNVELSKGRKRTEIDAVVVTSKAIFIIEVKNTGKDIFISEEGIYYRVSEYMRKDCNIKEKLETKENLLSSVFENAGITDVNVEKIVVFTNDNIEVQNKCSSINVAFLDFLPILIEDYAGDNLYSEESMTAFAQAIDTGRCHETYPVDESIKNFKKSFSIAMSTLEMAEFDETSDKSESMEVQRREKNIWSIIGQVASSPYVREIGYVVAEIVFAAISNKLSNKHVA
ncbi:MAG: nuclease-related domain-containing protein [Bacillota bacterium]|nr:nuclease-related domain-containing protein [Bacillota bacterium]